MKKEKQVKSYQRRTKSGKMVTVKAHSAKYDAAEKAKEAAKKKGAGDEFEAKKSSVKKAISERSKEEADLIREQIAKYGGEKGKEIAKEEKPKKKETKPKKAAEPDKKKIKRPIGSGTLGPETKKKESEITPKQISEYNKKVRGAENKYTGGLGPTSYQKKLEIKKRELVEYHKTPEGKAMKKAAAQYSKVKEKEYAVKSAKAAERKRLTNAKEIIANKGKILPKKSAIVMKIEQRRQRDRLLRTGVSSTEFKAWYHDPKSEEGKAAAKKLKEKLGPEKYKEMNKKANDSYSVRGHLSMYKGIGVSPTKRPTKPVGNLKKK